MANPRGTYPFALFLIWAWLLLDVGLIIMMFFDPLYGLGAIILTLGIFVAFMLGWLPLPGDRRSGSRRRTRHHQ